MSNEQEDLAELPASMQDSMSLDGDVDKLRNYYDNWAATYDVDLAPGYQMPGMVVRTLREALNARPDLSAILDPNARVVDAGCGTGAVGAELVAAGWQNIHGVDLSAEMVQLAEARNIYRSLTSGIDLTEPVADSLRHSADAVTIGGVFTVGHVPPEALAVVASLVRPGGVLSISVRDAYLEETNFNEFQRQLTDDGVLEPLAHIQNAGYTMDSHADYWAWLVN